MARMAPPPIVIEKEVAPNEGFKLQSKTVINILTGTAMMITALVILMRPPSFIALYDRTKVDTAQQKLRDNRMIVSSVFALGAVLAGVALLTN